MFLHVIVYKAIFCSIIVFPFFVQFLVFKTITFFIPKIKLLNIITSFF